MANELVMGLVSAVHCIIHKSIKRHRQIHTNTKTDIRSAYLAIEMVMGLVPEQCFTFANRLIERHRDKNLKHRDSHRQRHRDKDKYKYRDTPAYKTW